MELEIFLIHSYSITMLLAKLLIAECLQVHLSGVQAPIFYKIKHTNYFVLAFWLLGYLSYQLLFKKT